MDTLKFVIVGHVDHGKSTLIGRLLYDTKSLSSDRLKEIEKISKDLGRQTEFAYLLDHLEEERRQGITIDTTQVFFKTPKREYVIIDAPGHIEFVKNMITGASQAEAAILIVDAEEGVKEQSRRHAYILSLLGIKQVIVVLNKMDLVDFSQDKFNEVKSKVEEFLKSLGVTAIFYIPISALAGDNIASNSKKMNWYPGPNFLESLDTLTSRKLAQDRPLIFSVQDIYKIDDKRIIAGRLEAGVLKEGDSVEVLPSNQVTKVKSIEKYLEDTDTAYAGQSIGITTEDAVFINNGDIVCETEEKPNLTDTFKASIFWMAKDGLKNQERLTIRCSTQEAKCNIESIKTKIDSSTFEVITKDQGILNNLEVAQVTIKTKTPIAVKTFEDLQELGRFVLVRDRNVCAGGIVTDF